jgi:hypothetical protein
MDLSKEIVQTRALEFEKKKNLSKYAPAKTSSKVRLMLTLLY